VAEASLRVLDALVVAALSGFEYTRSVRPSSILMIYLFLSIFFDAIQLRTLWLLEYSSSLSSVATASLILKLAILIVEAQSKLKQLPSKYSHLPPESTTSLFNRGLFWWLTPLLLRGYRTLLEPNDLFQTDPHLSSRSPRSKILILMEVISTRQQVPTSPHCCLGSEGSNFGLRYSSVVPDRVYLLSIIRYP
jgi:ATP-binding cassette subfamily C (CFTR/MRP) protein 1